MPQLHEELTTDFSDGMYDSVAPTRYPRAAVAAIYNGRIQPDGTVRRRSGTIKTSAAAPNTGVGYGGVHFRTAGGVDQIIAICGAVAKYSIDEGVNWTQMATGLRQDYYNFATMREGATNYLFAANGDTTVKNWTGAAWSTVTNCPSGVKYVATFNNRLYVAGHSGILVQGSKIGDQATWASPDGLTVQVGTHSGDVPTGLCQVGPHLLVFNRESTSYIDGYGQQTLVVAQGATGFSRSVGCVGFRTIVPVGDNGVCWLSERGVEYYVPGASIRLLSRSVQEFMETIDWEELYANPGRMTAAYEAQSQDYSLALSTNGSRNNRILVLNLQEPGILDQRRGKVAAASVDRLQSPDSGDILFGGDNDGYLIEDPGGVEAKADSNGYMTLAALSGTGDPISADSDGYLEIVTNDTLPASLFTAPTSAKPETLLSLGYDGFCRKHNGVDADDMASDETGGTDVAMTITTKPHLMKQERRRKRARVIHVGSLQEENATVSVRLKGRGTQTGQQDITMQGLGLDHADRQYAMDELSADGPQVELTTTDDVRVSLLGVSAEIIREPF
jgi:hypothetical protein